ncbi:unnamed protein product [Lampetra planeri]
MRTPVTRFNSQGAGTALAHDERNDSGLLGRATDARSARVADGRMRRRMRMMEPRAGRASRTPAPRFCLSLVRE